MPVVIGNVPLGGGDREIGSGFQPELAANFYPPLPDNYIMPAQPPLSTPVDAWGQPPPYTPSDQMPIGLVDPIKKI